MTRQRITLLLILAAGLALAAAGLEVRTFAAGFRGTENLAFDGLGHLYVSDTNHLFRVDAAGKNVPLYERDPEADGISLGGVSLGPDGRVYFSAGNQIKTYDPETGAVADFAEGFDFANGVCFDGFGNLYVADSNAKKLYVVRAGAAAVEVLDEKAGWINGLIWSRRDNAIYYTVSFPGKVGVYRLGAGPIILEKLVLANLRRYGLDDLTLDDEGNIYVCAWLNGKVIKVTPGGARVTLLNKLDGPSAVAFGLGDESYKLYIGIKGGNTKFRGDRVLEIELGTKGYAEPFVTPEDED